MFVVRCPRCRRRRLLGTQRVRALRNRAVGVIVVELTCHCGHPVTVLTGGGREPVQLPPPD